MSYYRFSKAFSQIVKILFGAITLLGFFYGIVQLCGANLGIPWWVIFLMITAKMIPYLLGTLFLFLTYLCFVIGVECMPEVNDRMNKLAHTWANCMKAMIKYKKAKQKALKEELK